MKDGIPIPTDALERIRQVFEEHFAPWRIRLPRANVYHREKQAIHENGWTIHYRFGVEGGREYLEYFASHRMTNDTLQRIYADGEVKVIGYCQEFYTVGDPEAERTYSEHNRKFYAMVEEKGLG